LVILTVWVGGFCVLGVSRLLSEDV
jgi:hypothetical protein